MVLWHRQVQKKNVLKQCGIICKVVRSGNIGNKIKEIDNSKCPIILLTGEYDYSATPEETKSLADTIGVNMIKMKNVGHFPMSENPKEFLKYLYPVLDEIL